jgi:hypothetical protein
MRGRNRRQAYLFFGLLFLLIVAGGILLLLRILGLL